MPITKKVPAVLKSLPKKPAAPAKKTAPVKSTRSPTKSPAFAAPYGKPAAKKTVAKPVDKADFKKPKNLATAADRMYTVRQERYAAQKIVDALQAEETFLANHLVDNLPKDDATGAIGKVAKATITSKTKPRVVDWPKLHAYILKNKAFDLLQKRVADEAVMSRFDAGKKIPGVDTFKAIGVSLNKV